ncbi:hypothetical protein EV1_026161 [Malus domestica]
MRESDFSGSTFNGAYMEKVVTYEANLREEHGGVCFGWEFVPQGKLLYILDGDNVRHGLNCDLSFKAEHRAENIHRIGSMCMPLFRLTKPSF